MNKINTILDLLITNSGMNAADIARQIDVPYNTLNKIHNGTTASPGIETAAKIAAFFGITLDQLIGNAPLENYYEKNLACIPVINPQEITIESIKELTTMNYTQWHRMEVSDLVKGHDLFAVKVSGVAMAPRFDEQTLAIIDRNMEVKNNRNVFAYIKSINEYVIRKYFFDGNHRLLKAYNSDFPTIYLKDDDQIIGVVISSRKDEQ
jgi:transcriptional regulator with XRE-family HTH domain